MTRNEHRDIIAFIDRAVRQDDSATPNPLDVEADAIIRALFVRNPEAAYRVTMLAMAQQNDLAQVKTELAEEKSASRKNWISRLLKKQKGQKHNRRRDPNLSLVPQNVRSR